MALVNNYDENEIPECIDDVLAFFGVHGTNSGATLTNLCKKLNDEFTAWAKFTYCPQPSSDEQWDSAEEEFLAENYRSMIDVKQAFNLNWPYLIDESELV